MSKTLFVNLGCGFDKKPGFTNVDSDPEKKPDVLHDITKTLPFLDNSCDLVLASHIFEHIVNLTDVVKDIHRILKPGGKLNVAVPCFGCKAALIDPSHVRFFIPETFLMFSNPTYFTPNTYEGSGLFEIEDLEVTRWIYGDETEIDAGQFFTEIRVKFKKVLPEYWATLKQVKKFTIKQRVDKAEARK